jgi:hypothetical protein
MKLIFKQILSIVFLLGALSSCKKSLLDINVSPNDPTTASASAALVLSNALNTTARIYNNPTGGDNTFAFAGLWLGHISYSGNYAVSTENLSYALTNNFAAGAFGNLYDNIEDYDFVQKKGEATGNTFYRAIGIFMKAYNYQTLVDLYNNVPYSNALLGTGASTPTYDDAKTIYIDLAKKMDTAINIFKTSAAANTITGDIMFGGDASQWATFANTVKLRLLLRQSGSSNSAAAAAQASTLSGGFSTSDVTVNPGYLNSAGKSNPFWGSNINTTGTYTQDFYRAGQYAISFFQNNNDPRLSSFYTPIGGGTTTIYAGNYFGDQGIQNSKTSQIGPGVLKSFSQPAVVMLAAESYFLQSEAVLRGWITVSGETAQSLYEKGVTASFTYLGLSASQATTYFSQSGNKKTTWAATAGFQEQLALIIRQKWAAETWINELEPYNDYRRLHLPADIPLSSSNLSTGIFPNRLLYPQREYDVNSKNVLLQGTITPGNKVWWMP